MLVILSPSFPVTALDLVDWFCAVTWGNKLTQGFLSLLPPEVEQGEGKYVLLGRGPLMQDCFLSCMGNT